MLPIITIPRSVNDYLAKYREVFCRDEGFEWVSRYVTGLLISPHKTVQGIYDLLVFPEAEQKPSRRAMHQAVFEAGWSPEQLISRHHEVIAPDYQQLGRVVISLDWTYGHHERGERIYGVKKGYDYTQHRSSRYQTVLTAVVANRERFDGLDAVLQTPSFEKEEKAYLDATAKPAYTRREELLQRLTELLSYEANRKAYKKRTQVFLELVQRIERVHSYAYNPAEPQTLDHRPNQKYQQELK